MRRLLSLPAFAFVLVASVFAPFAHAQPVSSAELWQPLQLRNDAQAVGINPANLLFLETFEAGIGAAIELGEANPMHARGALGWSPGRLLGVGAQFASAVHGPDAIVARWGLASGVDQLGVGWSVDHWYASRGSAWRGVVSHRLGLSARFSPVVGVAVVVDALNQPYIGDARLLRSYRGALTLRSSREHIGAEFGLNVWQESYTGAFSFTLRPVDGVRLFGSLNLSPSDADVVQSASVGVELAVRHNAASIGVAHMPGRSLLSAYSSVFSTPGPQAVSRGRVLWRIDVGPRLFQEYPSRTLGGREEATFVDVLLALERLAEPGGIAGVFLDVQNASGGPAQLWELHQALQRVRASGKSVVVYLSDASLRGLYVASAADVVVAAPTSVLLRNGIGGTRYYLAELLQNIGVEPQFVRIGEYKSGPERFTNTGPSEEATAQLDAYLADTYATFLSPIEDSSGLGADAFAEAWQALPLSPDDLEELGNVDFVSHRDELSDRMRAVLGDVSVSRSPSAQPERDERWFPANPIAVLHIDGGIVSGSGGAVPLLGGFETGSAEIAAACEEILDDGRIRGVILRIDSPGGSATASEDMHRAVMGLAAQLPVIVSLADVAGSGGYYVASIGEPIV
ncbi:MAG: ClpP class serine protease, partial [Bradymonadia bacterium]